MKFFLFISFVGFGFAAVAQNVGINITTPQATLDVRGNQRFGGVNKFLSYDSISGKFGWTNSYLFVPNAQYLMQHSASAEGLYYGNSQLEYRNHLGNPVFYTNWNNGNGYFRGNLGLGYSTPAYPLSFPGTLGDKISLWTDGTSTHYGLGVQSGTLQIFAKSNVDGVAFGYGSSNTFTELMRVNGSATLDVNRGTAGWGTAAFRGTSNISHFNFGTDEDTYIRAGKNNRNVILNDIPGGKVGIGTNNPNAPLGFPAALGKKITLYPGGTGDVGFAVQGNLLQIYSDHPNADIAFGYDQAGVMTERFRMKANGALAVNGNTGQPKQLLVSNGSGAASSWITAGNLMKTSYATSGGTMSVTSTSWVEVPLNQPSNAITMNVDVRSRLIISAHFMAWGPFCPVGCGDGGADITIEVDGSLVIASYDGGITSLVAGGNSNGAANISNYFYDVNPGSHSIKFKTKRRSNRATNNLEFFECTEATVIALPID